MSYLIYHAEVGSVPYPGSGPLKAIYLSILISHIILAIVNVPLVALTLMHAFKDNKEKHRKFAKVTFPIWIYVSVSGIVVFVMLYNA